MKKKTFERSKLISVRLDREMLKRLEILSIERQKYRSELIHEAIADYLKKEQALQKSRQSSGD